MGWKKEAPLVLWNSYRLICINAKIKSVQAESPGSKPCDKLEIRLKFSCEKWISRVQSKVKTKEQPSNNVKINIIYIINNNNNLVLYICHTCFTSSNKDKDDATITKESFILLNGPFKVISSSDYLLFLAFQRWTCWCALDHVPVS